MLEQQGGCQVVGLGFVGTYGNQSLGEKSQTNKVKTKNGKLHSQDGKFSPTEQMKNVP